MFGFLGPNGAGKTTAIRLLLGFLRPSRGRARVFGYDCWRDSPRIKADLGYLPGDLRLYSWIRTTDALRIFGRVRGRDLSRAGLELAERFGLDADVRVRDMSRGMRQKLGLVIAMASNPKLLILDEPTASLDPLVQQELFRELRDRASRGDTIFFSSHNLGEVEDLCERVAILRGGKLVADEEVRVLRERAGREVVIRWASESAAERARPPGALEVCAREHRVWRCALKGAVPEILRWAADQPIDDLSIGPPDLERLFSRYYRDAEGPA